MTTKDRLHQLIDQLPDQGVVAAEEFLSELVEAGGDPVLRMLNNAPLDDEPLTEEDIAAIQAAKARIRSGRGVPHEEAKRRLLGHP
ncbi:MAG: hypothetical protein NTZ05_00235 [Chloroflexi bacterium]|nr:hypothetical protein [Chloroflexota bacterium]